MNRAMLQRRLAVARRHVAGGEQCVARQREIIVRLERAGLGASETASFARDLLHQFEVSLRREVAELTRLQAQSRT